MDLSVCVPIYNNILLFPHCLEAIGRALKGVENRVEIVISDNASEDDIFGVIQEFQERHPDIIVTYNRNANNMGPAYNVHKVVEVSNGKFNWIIGSDDFVAESGVRSILNILDENADIDFISVNYTHIELSKVHDESDPDDPYHKILTSIYDRSLLTLRHVKKTSERIEKWDMLIDPDYKNLMMGALMAGVFRRTRWMSVNTENMDKSSEHSNVENTYPHIAVFANCMIGRPSYYLNEEVIIVGEGARPWMGRHFWDGSLPVIYLKTIDQIVDYYRDRGLIRTQVIRCRTISAKLAGNVFISFLRRKYIKKKYIHNQQYIYVTEVITRFWRYSAFYQGLRKDIKQIREGIKNNAQAK